MVTNLSKTNVGIDEQLGPNLPHATNIGTDMTVQTFPPKNRRVRSLQDLPFVLSVDELMEVLDIGRNTAYALVRSGQIRSIKVGKIYRISRDAVEEFLKK